MIEEDVVSFPICDGCVEGTVGLDLPGVSDVLEPTLCYQ